MNLRVIAASLCLAIPVSASARVWTAVSPAVVDPGGVFEVKAGNTLRGAVSASTAFHGQSVALIPVNGVLRGLVGVPAATGPGKYSVTTVVDGANVVTSIQVRAKAFPHHNMHMAPGKTKLMDQSILTRERDILFAVLDRRTPEPLWRGAFIVPVAGPHSSEWGAVRTVNGRPWSRHHEGADIAAPVGIPVRATNDGVVVLARALWMRGNIVVVNHGMGLFSVYQHLSRIDVRAGQNVTRAERVGLVGKTGFVTGPHLHWEMRVGRVPVNPWPVTRTGIPLG